MSARRKWWRSAAAKCVTLPPWTRRSRFRPRCEHLEPRDVPAVFIVTNTGDNGGIDPVPFAGTGTLRQAIIDANAEPGPDQIVFEIPGGGVQTIAIAPGSPLPTITETVAIDGYTQPDSSPNTLSDGIDAVLTVVLDGGYEVDTGLTIADHLGSEIAGLVITRFAGAGVLISGGGGHTLAGNFLGPDQTGTKGRLSNFGNDRGVIIGGGSFGNSVGGADPADRNLISGNVVGVEIGGPDTFGNFVVGNSIGPDIAGAFNDSLGSLIGVRIRNGASANIIGGINDVAQFGNVISANEIAGVLIDSEGTKFNEVSGNLIGTDPTGTSAVPNGIGVLIDAGASNNIIGPGPLEGANTISGNTSHGVMLRDEGTNRNEIRTNYIGTDPAGTFAIPNGGFGVLLTDDASGNAIGSLEEGFGNLIAGNKLAGIAVETDDNVVAGNWVGTDDSGTKAIPNSSGIAVGGSKNLIIGLYTTDGKRQIIAGNTGDGLFISGTGNSVLGNLIGTDLTGTAAVPNGGNGIHIGGAGNFVGGENELEGNLISGNAGSGVVIAGVDAAGNKLIGNVIGAVADGTAPLGNGGDGVRIADGATGNVVGPGAITQSNIIGGNQGSGVRVSGEGTTGNLIGTNNIGTDPTGAFAVPNGKDGVRVEVGANGNTVGISSEGRGNLISGNLGNGVVVFSNDNAVVNNFIGVDGLGTAAIPNKGIGLVLLGNDNVASGKFVTAGFVQVISGNALDGVAIEGSGNAVTGTLIGTDRFGAKVMANGGNGIAITGPDNTVGGSGVDNRNLISGNVGSGVAVLEATATGNFLINNSIGTDATGLIALGNKGDGVLIGEGASGNIVGGVGDAEGNLISANAENGIRILGTGTNNNSIIGNFIGTNPLGKLSLGNGLDGIRIDGAAGNTVGGVGAARNVISGNVEAGIRITGLGADDNVLIGNAIGTTPDGSAALGNAVGVIIESGAENNRVGPGPMDQSNTISGNVGAGVIVMGEGTAGNVIATNYIGTDPTGSFAVPNSVGVVIDGGATRTTIGSAVKNEGNLISGNDSIGVRVDGDENLIVGNFIGLDDSGGKAIPNRADGLVIAGKDNVVSGKLATEGFRQAISGNLGNGITITGLGNRVFGTLIGTDRLGIGAVPNGLSGVVVAGGKNVIGLVGELEANLISGNEEHGVVLIGDGATENRVVNNLIGTDTGGSVAVPNGGSGVFVVDGASRNTIGGAFEEGNLIAFNVGAGVVIGRGPEDIATVGNAVLANEIFSNGDIPVDLGNDGPTPNGANPRPFPNDGQNFPVLVTAISGRAVTLISGTLNSVPNSEFRVEFFAGQSPGQANDFLGFTLVSTDGTGFAGFSFATDFALISGVAVVATATQTETRNTSELSTPVEVMLSPRVQVAPATLPAGIVGRAYEVILTATGGVGGSFTFAVTAGALPPGLTLSADGTISGTPSATGTFPFSVTATDNFGDSSGRDYDLTVTAPVPPVPPVPPTVGPLLAVGAGVGGGPHVVVYNPDRSVRFSFFAFAPSFTGGVRVATGDVTGDGIDDIVLGAGAGGGPRINVYDGVTGSLLRSFFAFDPSFRGGVFVAVGDLNGDGFGDIVVGAGAGGGPHVVAFDGKTGAQVRSFFAFAPNFTGGVAVAAGDTDGNGRADIVVGAGAGGGPHVKAFDGVTLVELLSFFAFAPNFTGGVAVAAGDFTGRGGTDILTGAGFGGGPEVTAFEGRSGIPLRSLFAYNPSFRGGVNVATWDIGPGGTAVGVAANGPGIPVSVVFSPTNDPNGDIVSLAPFGLEFLGGAFVG